MTDSINLRSEDFKSNHKALPEDLLIKAPIFAECLSRMPEWEKFAEFIGSLFDSTPSTRKLFLLYGPTDGGKSFLLNVLDALFPKGTCKPFDPNEIKKKYFVPAYLGVKVAFVQWDLVKFIKSKEFNSSSFLPETIFVATLTTCEREELSHFLAQISPWQREKIHLQYVASIDKQKQINDGELREMIKKEIPTITGFCQDFWDKQKKTKA